jgi:hypothetical protein
MKQAIMTKTIEGASNTRTVFVYCRSARSTYPWYDYWTIEENHIFAALLLAESMGWPVCLIGGENSVGDGYCFIPS